MIGEVQAGSMGQIVIKAEAEVLFASADSAAGRIASIKKRFDTIEQTVNQSADYWIGPAGEQHRRSYQRYSQQIEEALSVFQEHVDDLRKIAQNYADTDLAVKELSQDLPQDVLV